MYNNFLPRLTQKPNDELINRCALVLNRSSSFFHEMSIFITLRAFISEMISIPTFQRKHVFIHTFVMWITQRLKDLVSSWRRISFSEKYVASFFFLNRKEPVLMFCFYEQFSEIQDIFPVTVQSVSRDTKVYVYICICYKDIFIFEN